MFVTICGVSSTKDWMKSDQPESIFYTLNLKSVCITPAA